MSYELFEVDDEFLCPLMVKNFEFTTHNFYDSYLTRATTVRCRGLLQIMVGG